MADISVDEGQFNKLVAQAATSLAYVPIEDATVRLAEQEKLSIEQAHLTCRAAELYVKYGINPSKWSRSRS